LIQISDLYNNTIQFEYKSVSPYGQVLSKIRDVLGNEINFTYTSTEVLLTLGDRTVKYEKIKDPQGNKELLSQVTDTVGRKTQYVYEIVQTPFDLVGNSMKENYTALIKHVYHPTQAHTDYTYDSITRSLGSVAREVVYRVKSREDVVDYQNGTALKANKVSYSYIGDGAASSQSDLNFSTTVSNGLIDTTYKYLKKFIDQSTPEVIFNKEIIEQAVGTNPIEKKTTVQTYDEIRRLPVPNTIIVTNSTGTATSTPAIVSRTFDDYGNVLTEKNPNNVQTTYSYDASTH